MKKLIKENVEKENYSGIFLFMAILFVSCILISNILATKVIHIFGFNMTGGVLVFPISYILGDVITEVYGYKKSKRVIIYGFICNLIMVLLFQLAIKLPAAPFWGNQDAFVAILSSTPRLLLASFVGYLVGGLSNSFIMDYIKNNSKIKYLWFRTILSTIIGEGLDTLIFLTVGFFGTMPFGELMYMVLCQSVFKILYEVIFTPATYKVISFVKRRENIK